MRKTGYELMEALRWLDISVREHERTFDRPNRSASPAADGCDRQPGSITCRRESAMSGRSGALFNCLVSGHSIGAQAALALQH